MIDKFKNWRPDPTQNNLDQITIPDDVISIEHGAFVDFKNLKAFNGKFASADHRCLIIDGELVAFAQAGLTKYTIPEGVTTISAYAFQYCESIEEITIANTVTSIGMFAFQYCKNLESITISDSLKNIESYAFDGCKNLKAFYGALASADHRCLIIDGELVAFAQAGLTKYAIPEVVTSIGDHVFLYCKDLELITIPNTVVSIGERAFESCKSLKAITIPDSVKSVGRSAFRDCKNLREITIPNSVTFISNWVFGGCENLKAFYGKFASADHRCLIIDGELVAFAPSGLTKYEVPEGVTSIGKYAFNSCAELEEVTLPKSVTFIGERAFEYCKNLAKIISQNVGWCAFRGTKFEK